MIRSFSKPYGIIRCYCSFCKYCILTQEKGKWICGADTKTYFTDRIEPDSWDINISCRNGKFEFDKEKFKGHRW